MATLGLIFYIIGLVMGVIWAIILIAMGAIEGLNNY